MMRLLAWLGFIGFGLDAGSQGEGTKRVHRTGTSLSAVQLLRRFQLNGWHLAKSNPATSTAVIAVIVIAIACNLQPPECSPASYVPTRLPGTSFSSTLTRPCEQIEHLGVVSAISELDTTESGGGGWSLTISDAAPILNDCHIGDSIAVNGCCLTVTEFDTNSFKVGLAPETLSRTNLGAPPAPRRMIFFPLLFHSVA